MKKTSIAAVAAGILGLGVMSSACAHDTIGFSISFGDPVYYEPRPVYVAPPPVYYAPPPVVYYRPAPVYYGPQAYFRFDDGPHFRVRHDHDFHRGWHKHHFRHDDD